MNKDHNILIIEDEFLVQQEMKTKLFNIGYTNVFLAKNEEEVIEVITTNKVDVALVDVGLANSNKDGIEIVKEIRKFTNPYIVFTTLYSDENTIKRTELIPNASYLVKPISERQIYVTLQQAFRHTTSSKNFNNCPLIPYKNSFYIKGSKKHYEKILIAELIYIQSSNGGLDFYTKDKKIFTYVSMQNAIEQIYHPQIVRVHKSYAVNIENVVGKSDRELIMINGTKIKISQSYRENIEKQLFTIKPHSF